MKKLFKVLLLALLVVVSAIGVMACNNKNNDGGGGGGTPPTPTTPIYPDQYHDESRDPDFNVYNGITLDGVMSDGEWDNYNVYETEISLGGVDHDVIWCSTFSNEGAVFAIQVEGTPVYYNINRSMTENSGIEIYVAPGGTTDVMGKAWQMEIMPNGIYQTHLWHSFGGHNGYRTANAYLEVEGTVLGAPLNDPNSTGYVIEWMIPWSVFGYNSNQKPSHINMDVAFLYCSTFNGPRDAWVSMRQTKENKIYSWTNPSSWYTLTEFGFYNEDGDILSVINDGEEVVNGTVEVSGTFKEGGAVVITPDDGYVLKSLVINGKKVNSLYYSMAPASERVLYIDVEFKPAIGNPVDFNVVGGYVYTEKVNLGKNISFALTNEAGEVFVGLTDDDGVATVYVPDGEYAYSMDGYTGGTVTVNSADNVAYDLTFTKIGISADGKGATISGLDSTDGVTIIGTPSSTLRMLNGFGSNSSVDFNGKVVVEYDYEVELGQKTCTFLRWLTTADTFYNNQVAWVGANYIDLKQKETIVTRVPGDPDGIARVHIVYVIEDNTATCFLKTTDGYELLFTNVAAGKITGYYLESVENETYYAYKNFKVYDGVFANQIAKAPLTVSSTGESSVEFNKPQASLGDLITVTVTPNEATEGKNVVTSVKINNEDVDYVVNADGTIVAEFRHNGNIPAYDVAVTTANVNPVEVDLSIKITDIKDNLFALANKDFKVSGVLTAFGTTDADGNATLELVDGSYIIEVDGYLKSTFVVADGALTTDNILIAENIFIETDKFDYGFNTAEGYWFTSYQSVNKLYFIDDRIAEGDVISFTYTGKVKQGANHYPEIQVFDNNGNSICLQLSQWNGTLNLKDVAAKTVYAIANDVESYTANLCLVLTNGVIEVYFADGTYITAIKGVRSSSGNDGASFGDFASFHWHFETDNPAPGNWKISNFKVLRAAAVDTIINAETADVVIKNAKGDTLNAIPFALDVKIYVTPTAGNYLKSIKVNGVVQAISYEDDKAYVALKYQSLDPVTIEVITTDTEIITKSVALSLSHKFAYASASALANGTAVKLVGEDSAITLNVTDGKINATLPVGSYQVVVDYHAPYTLVIDDSTSSELDVVLLRKVITHYGDYSSYITNDGTDGTNGASIVAPGGTQFIRQYFYFAESVDFNQANIVEYNLTMDTSCQVFSGLFYRGGDKLSVDGFYTYFNQGCWKSSVIWLRKQDASDSQYTANADNANMNGSLLTVKVVVVTSGNEIKYYVIDKEGSVNLVHTSEKPTVTHVMTKIDDCTGTLKWENIKVYDGADVATRLTELGIN
ncbi:MAG: hypothetical protein J6B16_03340 [Clostridia bacterium]|nr:hypothetical protein [Clostridia bacterium]